MIRIAREKVMDGLELGAPRGQVEGAEHVTGLDEEARLVRIGNDHIEVREPFSGVIGERSEEPLHQGRRVVPWAITIRLG